MPKLRSSLSGVKPIQRPRKLEVDNLQLDGNNVGVVADTDLLTLDTNNLSVAGIQSHSNTISSNVTIASSQNAVVSGPYVVDATLTISGNMTVV